MGEVDDATQLRLDHRHLAFFFLGAVAVCAIFFALGFVVGRGQNYEAAVKEQSLGAKSLELKPTANQPAAAGEGPGEDRKVPVSIEKLHAKRDQETDYRRELDFYNTLDQKNGDHDFRANDESLPKGPTSETKSKPLATPKTSIKAFQVSLQVGAYGSASDAQKVVRVLRSKGYSVSLLTPVKGNNDKLIRIHVGPFAQLKEANKAKAQLERDGFQAIIKR
jgi:cell division protein FtsN